MAIQLKNFQLKAIDSLMDAMHNDKKEIILKSCTGSGKTIILTHFIDTYMRSFGNTVGLLRVKAIWKNKAKLKWINTYTALPPNCYVML